MWRRRGVLLLGHLVLPQLHDRGDIAAGGVVHEPQLGLRLPVSALGGGGGGGFLLSSRARLRRPHLPAFLPLNTVRKGRRGVHWCPYDSLLLGLSLFLRCKAAALARRPL